MDGRKKDGHGSRTVRSRKQDGMVTEAGRDGHGEWSKTKDLLYQFAQKFKHASIVRYYLVSSELD